MKSLTGFCAVAVVASTLATSASAAIITFTQQNIWEGYSALQSVAVYTETFNGIADGFYASQYSCTTGPVNWTASATVGIYVQSGLFSTNNPETLT
ncbi:MAG: hypothetical protein ACKO3W_03955, partial [bacterium]